MAARQWQGIWGCGSSCSDSGTVRRPAPRQMRRGPGALPQYLRAFGVVDARHALSERGDLRGRDDARHRPQVGPAAGAALVDGDEGADDEVHDVLDRVVLLLEGGIAVGDVAAHHECVEEISQQLAPLHAIARNRRRTGVTGDAKRRRSTRTPEHAQTRCIPAAAAADHRAPRLIIAHRSARVRSRRITCGM